MLTYSPNAKPQRKDRPWLLVLLGLIWIGGASFFHAPWEPYEPFVVAVVKSILATNSWLVPRIAEGTPYLDLQPFYFWIYAIIIRIFHFNDIVNAIRLINSVIIFLVIYFLGRVGSKLTAYKNGRTVVMILISSIGFINNAYQLSPNIVVLLGFTLFFYALQQIDRMPGISAWILSLGLILVSLNFTGEFIVIALLLLVILPVVNRQWNHSRYYLTVFSGIGLFALIFFSYAWQLEHVNHHFFVEWKSKYSSFLYFTPDRWFRNTWFYLQTIGWYLVPGWFLLLWTFYKRRKQVFKDKILQASVIFILLLFIFAVASNNLSENVIFPLIIPFVLLASVEVDSIRITIVSLLNWFSLFIFGFAGVCIALLYIALNFGHPLDLLSRAQFYAPTYVFNFNFWQFSLAAISAAIWVFMITRKHIRGREMITNWASGTTFVLAMFVSLCMPWFNQVLTFKDVVNSSIPYLDKQKCIAATGSNRLQNAIWYYYADVVFVPNRNIMASGCRQALIAVEPDTTIDYPGWDVIWSAKRPIDTRRYLLLQRKEDLRITN